MGGNLAECSVCDTLQLCGHFHTEFSGYLVRLGGRCGGPTTEGVRCPGRLRPLTDTPDAWARRHRLACRSITSWTWRPHELRYLERKQEQRSERGEDDERVDDVF